MKNFFCFLLLLPLFASAQQFLAGARDTTVPYFSSNLPIIKIWVDDRTAVVDTNKRAVMEIVDGSKSQSRQVSFRSRVKIKTRGSISADPSILKKQYAIGTLSDSATGLAKSIFGFPADEDWVLQSNYFDRSQLRNVLAYQLSREMGWYSPRTQPCELVLNGTYMGTHVLMEKITRNNGRVNIASVSAASPNGGYLFKKDHLDDPTDSVWYSSQDVHTNFVTVYPKASSFNATVKAFIKNKTDSFELILKSAGFDDTATGWVKYGDRAAFADWILLSELGKSLDFYSYSAYFSRTTNGKITPFPLWDWDWTFGDGEIDSSSSPRGWWYTQQRAGEQGLFWPGRMMQGPNFLAYVKTRWQSLRQTTLSQGHLYAIIEAAAEQYKSRGAVVRNFQRWPGSFGSLLANYYGPPGNYETDVQHMKDWLALRLAWMDSQLQ